MVLGGFLVGAGFSMQASVGLWMALGGLACVSLMVVAWLSTWRILRPVRELSRVAEELRRGRLTAGPELDADADVGEVATALRRMADRLSRQLDDQRALMAAVSHELRSPLARARVLVEMAREGSAPHTLQDDLEAEIDAMDGIVGDLLAASRIDFEAVQPRALAAVEVAARALEVAALDPELLRVEGDPPELEADPTLLARALATLLDNGGRYGGAVVALTVSQQGDGVAFVVDDDGPGFGPGDVERAFEPFWRAGGEAQPRGEGLGLALVRRIAEAHGGTANAENREGGGARVTLRLPA